MRIHDSLLEVTARSQDSTRITINNRAKKNRVLIEEVSIKDKLDLSLRTDDHVLQQNSESQNLAMFWRKHHLSKQDQKQKTSANPPSSEL